jgi:RHS repeat-associated protein
MRQAFSALIHRASAGWIVLVGLLFGLLLARPVQADVTPTGAYQTTVPIDVPPYHGLEPRLSLDYNSSGGNGWLGVGWSMSGLSTIERASPGRGTPNYDANDIFLLDGMELLPCEAGMQSPSCMYPAPSNGPAYVGYVAKIETFERIAYDSAVSGHWYVWSKTGTRMTFAPRLASASRTSSDVAVWRLVSVQDVLGNEVSYTYTPPLSDRVQPGIDQILPETYLSAITYNGAMDVDGQFTGVAIRFFNEPRPDPISYANGRSLTTMSERLSTIDVTVGGERARAYIVSYETASASTGRSLLSSVQQFGRDATLDESGTIIGGTAFPSTTASPAEPRSGQAGMWEQLAPVNLPWQIPDVRLSPRKPGTCAQLAARVDLPKAKIDELKAPFACGSPALSGAPVFGTHSAGQEVGKLPAAETPVRFGDPEGDGRAKWMQAWAEVHQSPPNSPGSQTDLNFLTAQVDPTTGQYVEHVDSKFWPEGRGVGRLDSWAVDLNGDGRTDHLLTRRVFIGADNPPTQMQLQLQPAFSDGDGKSFTLGPLQPTPWVEPYYGRRLEDPPGESRQQGLKCQPADVNGDGREDLVCLFTRDVRIVGTALSRGDGSFAFVEQPTPPWITLDRPPDFFMADANGDGLPDIMYRDFGHVITGISSGDGHYAFTDEDLHLEHSAEEHLADLVGDVNGDGRADFVWVQSQWIIPPNGSGDALWFYTKIWTARTEPDGSHHFSERQDFPTYLWTDRTSISLGEVNGDHKADLLIATQWRSGGFPDFHPIQTAGIKCDQFPHAGPGESDRGVLVARVASRGDGTFELPVSPAGWDTCDQWHFDSFVSTDQTERMEAFAIDLNGDGLDDFFIASECLPRPLSDCRRYTRPGMVATDDVTLSTREDVANWRYGDLSGQGSTDMVYLAPWVDGVHVFSVLALAPDLASAVKEAIIPPTGLSVPNNRDWRLVDIGSPSGKLDGRADMVHLEAAGAGTVQLRVLLSTGYGTWTPANGGNAQVFAIPGLVAADTLRARFIDVDGDGAADIVFTQFVAPGKLRISTLVPNLDGTWRSGPSSDVELPAVESSTVAVDAGDAQNVLALDRNGDGRMDLAIVQFLRRPPAQGGGGEGKLGIYTLLSTGRGSWELADEGKPFQLTWDGVTPADLRRVMPVDANGDGKTDLAFVPTPDALGTQVVRVLLSGGAQAWTEKRYSVGGAANQPEPVHPVGDWLPLDANADGISDLVYVESLPSGTYTRTLLGRADGTSVFRAWGDGSSAPQGLGWFPNHVNADPAADLSHLSFQLLDGELVKGQLQLTLLASRAPRDEAVHFGSPTGGSTAVEYRSSTVLRSDRPDPQSPCVLPSGSVLQLVSAVSDADGRNEAAPDRQDFRYGCPRWSDEEHHLIGWETIEATRQKSQNRPAFVQSTHHLIAGGGVLVPNNVETRDASGHVLNRAETAYQVTPLGWGAAAPYRVLATSGWQYQCTDTPTTAVVPTAPGCTVSQTDFAFDEFGNQIQLVEYGGVPGAHDETDQDWFTQTQYRSSTDLFIVGLPSSVRVFQGPLAKPARQLRASRYCYDGDQGACAAAPTRGLHTGTYVWDDKATPDPSDDAEYLTTYEYDAYGNLQQTTDANGHWTITDYDQTYHVYPVSTRNMLGHTTSQIWDYVIGQVKIATDANGEPTTYQYDSLSRLKDTEYPNGGAEHRDYFDPYLGDPMNQRTRIWVDDGSPDGLWSETYVDGLSRPYRLIKKADEQGGTFEQLTMYADATNNPFKKSLSFATPDPRPFYETYHYDELSRVIDVEHADGTGRRSEYRNDQAGTWTTTYDELGHRKDSHSDLRSQFSEVDEHVGPAIARTTYRHDPVGNLTTIVDAAGHATSLGWDSLGRQTSLDDLDLGGQWSYSHDPVGNLTDQTDPKGTLTTFAYDELNRRTARWWTHADGERTLAATWRYDEAGHPDGVGRLTSVSDPSGAGCPRHAPGDPYGDAELFAYDEMGHVAARDKCILGSSYRMAFGFDQVGTGRPSSATYPDGETVDTGYDAAGRVDRLERRARDGEPAFMYVQQQWHDPAGHLTKAIYGNGELEEATYDPKNARLTSDRVTLGGTPRFDSSYTYYANGLPRTVTSATNKMNMAYAYDDLDRLTDVTGPGVRQSFQYDLIGNRTFSSDLGAYQYLGPGPHAVSRVGDRIYGYDQNGNMILQAGAQIQWTDDNQPDWIQSMDGSWMRVLYDASGERVFTWRSDDVRHHYAGPYVGFTSTASPKGAPGILAKYYYADGRLVARTDQGGASWYHSDSLGTPHVISGKPDEEPVLCDYKPFGEPLGCRGPSSTPGELGYGGHEVDAETGLVYMAARYYDPSIGRFLSADSLVPNMAEPQALNRYAYAYNNPLVYMDPSGHFPISDEKWRQLYWAYHVLGLELDIVGINAYAKARRAQGETGTAPQGTGRLPQQRPTTRDPDSTTGGSTGYTCPHCHLLDSTLPPPDLSFLTDTTSSSQSDASGNSFLSSIIRGTQDVVQDVRDTLNALKLLGDPRVRRLVAQAVGHVYLPAAHSCPCEVTFGRGPAQPSTATMNKGGAGTEEGGSYPKDYPTKETNNWSANYKSEGEARALARQKVGSDPVEVEPFKWRSQDGKWQYRAKPGDWAEGHIHLEELDPQTGEVIQNVHLRWPVGAGR